MLRQPYCGGNWNNGSNAGVFNVNANNPRSNSNSNIGLRSAQPQYMPEGRYLRVATQSLRIRIRPPCLLTTG